MDIHQIAAALSGADDDAILPVDQWHPEHCGDIDIVIREDGTWIHDGSPIGRAQLVRLFSKVLRRDDDGYVLVTPAEKLSITVEDVPFVITDFDRVGADIRIRTNVGDEVVVGAEHPLEMRKTAGGENVAPYVLIRGRLWARFGRPAYYRLINEESCDEEGTMFIESGAARFALGSSE